MKVKIRKINNIRCLCEMPPLPVKCCIILIFMYARLWGTLRREGSLSCHTCWDMNPRFWGSRPKTTQNSIAIQQSSCKKDLFLPGYSQGSSNMNGIDQSINDYFIGGGITWCHKNETGVSVSPRRWPL